MTKRASDRCEQRTVDEEREYIEQLLNTRFNYYLVFISLLFLPVAGENPLSRDARIALLVLGGLVSALMACMVVRTKLLLDELLAQILSIEGHPYKVASDNIAKKPRSLKRNANDFMVALVVLIALLFALGVAVALVSPETLFKTEAAATPPQTTQAPTPAQAPPPAPAKPIPPPS